MNWTKNEKQGVTYITFPIFEKSGLVHGLSTKLGGVSKGHCATMNLGFKCEDDAEAVMENHRLFADAVGYDYHKLVFSNQVHGTTVRRVTSADAGKGIVRESDIIGVDGLVTNDEDVVLITFFADCVPLFFYDPVKRAIGASHSGWRGTVQRIGEKTVKMMEQEFGSRPEDIRVVVGPSICQACYEVSKDVADAFYKEFNKKWWEEILLAKGKNEQGEEKFQLDLWRSNEIVLEEAGIKKENRQVSGLCTCCHSDLLFSHRATGGRRGSLAGVITLGKGA